MNLYVFFYFSGGKLQLGFRLIVRNNHSSLEATTNFLKQPLIVRSDHSLLESTTHC